ncbi:MAG: selenide, water dikinase SelD, partial [Nitrospirae bacterium]
MSPAALGEILPGFRGGEAGEVIVGLDRPDDAGVVRLTEEIALVQTVDFFTPIVDDPYDYGRIAAANALSDVYAMGGTPVSAVNLLCLPVGKIDREAVEGILAGGRDKAAEAGCPIVGGQSVEDRELKYGLAVTGRIHPQRILRKGGGRPGDRLVLTKPLGVGLLTSAFKAGKGDAALRRRVTEAMATLSAVPARLALAHGATACTDVTGFGLLGHASEMVRATEVGLRLWPRAVPRFPEALERPYSRHRTRADATNRAYVAGVVEVEGELEPPLEALLY